MITEHRDEHGYHWRYQHAPTDGHETLVYAVLTARDLATAEARETGIAYVVGITPDASVVHVLAFNHPMVLKGTVNLIYEITPEGERIDHRPSRQ